MSGRTAHDLLDLLCRDSLEAPLSHVDNPQADGAVTALFRELRDLLDAQAQRLEKAKDVVEAARKSLPRTRSDCERMWPAGLPLWDALAAYNAPSHPPSSGDGK